MEYQEHSQTSQSSTLSAREVALLEGFRQLDEQAQQDVLRVVRALQGLPA